MDLLSDQQQGEDFDQQCGAGDETVLLNETKLLNRSIFEISQVETHGLVYATEISQFYSLRKMFGPVLKNFEMSNLRLHKIINQFSKSIKAELIPEMSSDFNFIPQLKIETEKLDTAFKYSSDLIEYNCKSMQETIDKVEEECAKLSECIEELENEINQTESEIKLKEENLVREILNF